MTGSVLAALPQFFCPFPSPADLRPAPKQPDAFGDLLDRKEERPARPAPPSAVEPATSPPQRATLPSGPASSEPSLLNSGAADDAPADGGKDDDLHARKEKETNTAWAGDLQRTAAPEVQQRLSAAPAGHPQAAKFSQDGMGAAALTSGTAELSKDMAVATLALRQRLLREGEDVPLAAGGAGFAASLETDAEEDFRPETSLASRRSRAAVASVALFQRERHADAETATAARRGGKAERQEPASKTEGRKGGEAPLLPDAAEGSQQAQPLNLPGMQVAKQAVTPQAFGALLAANAAGTPAAPNAGAAVRAVGGHELPASRISNLEVHLHPAELGSIVARLRIVEEQLSVEIVADSAEGRDSLATQESAIRASLEALGFRIDRLTIQQAGRPEGPGQAAQNAAGDPAGASPDRGASTGAGGAAEQNGRGGDARRNGDGETGAREAVSSSARAARGGSGVFI